MTTELDLDSIELRADPDLDRDLCEVIAYARRLEDENETMMVNFSKYAEAQDDRLEQVGIVVDDIEFIPQAIFLKHLPVAFPPGVKVDAVFRLKSEDA